MALAAVGLVGALAVGLGVTYVAGADDSSAPTRLTADPVSPTSATLSWRSTGADEYVVTVGADRALSSATTSKVPGTKSSLIVDDLTAESTEQPERWFRVDAVRDGEVVRSRTVRFALMPGELDAVKVAKVAANGFKATWKATANARQYDVLVASDKKLTKQVSLVRTLDEKAAVTLGDLDEKTTYFVAVRPVNDDQVGAWSSPSKLTTKAPATRFRVGSWNVCSEACSGYGSRAPAMAEFLNDAELDLFGLQEAGGARVGPQTNAAFSGGERKFKLASGGSKSRYIFYRPATFSQKAGGSFGIGNGRYTTWAKFSIRESGREFFVVNTHLTSGVGADGKRSRQMTTNVQQMASINADDLPIIYLGDFNSGRHRGSDSPGRIMRSVGMTDTYESSAKQVNAEYNSGHSFSPGDVPRSGDYVDHIFASDDFTVALWEQLVRMTGNRYTSPVLSDHNALSAVVELDAETTDIGDVTKTTPVPAQASASTPTSGG